MGYWTPHTSEVLGEYGIDVDEAKLQQWREQATQEVWDIFVMDEKGD